MLVQSGFNVCSTYKKRGSIFTAFEWVLIFGFYYKSLLATSSADGTAKIWRTVDFSLQIECKDNNQKWVWDLAFTNDSQYLFTGRSAPFKVSFYQLEPETR
jgi:WD40 repeat protein